MQSSTMSMNISLSTRHLKQTLVFLILLCIGSFLFYFFYWSRQDRNILSTDEFMLPNIGSSFKLIHDLDSNLGIKQDHDSYSGTSEMKKKWVRYRMNPNDYKEKNEKSKHEVEKLKNNGATSTMLPKEKLSSEKLDSNMYYGKPYKATWVESEGHFVDRVTAYNKALSELREKVLKNRSLTSNEWKDISNNVETLWGNKDTYLQELGKFNQVQTIALAWDNSSTMENEEGKWSSLYDQSNLIIQKYHEWAATEPLCKWINTMEFTKARWDAIYSRRCNNNMNKTLAPKSIEYVYFYGRPINPNHYWPNKGHSYPYRYYSETPDQDLYLHIGQDVVITGLGDILTGNLKLVPYSCSQDTNPSPPPNYNTTPIYDEIFVMTQHWGDQFFHKMLENFPRVAPYLEFLQENPTIKIHVAENGGYTADMLRFLGLNSERLITGVSRSKVVYLPQTTACGFPHIQNMQLLSYHVRKVIKEKFSSLDRNSIILIKRSGSRRLTQHQQIKEFLGELAKKEGFYFEEFRDSPVPSMEESMQIFSRAIMIVAPHGAGLSNMIFAEPGTFVIEGVCNPPHVNMCFQWGAHVLGHHYHGIPSRGGCEDVVDISVEAVEDVVRFYLSHMG